MSQMSELNRMCPIATRIYGSRGLGTWLQAGRTLDAELASDHAVQVTWDTEVDADQDEMNDYIYYLSERNGVCGGDVAAQQGTTDTENVRVVGPVWYRIDGQMYCAEGKEGALDLAGDDVTDGGYGAWAIMIDKEGTVTTKAAQTSADMNFSSAQDALLSLACQPRTANTVDLAYLVVLATTGGFTIGTDSPVTSDAALTSATYYDVRTAMIDNGLNVAMSADLAVGVSTLMYGHGTVAARTNALNVTTLTADNKAFTQNDTINALADWGGHLVVTDLAGTTIVTLAATGTAGGAQDFTMASQAIVGACLDDIQARLPLIFTSIGRIVVNRLMDTQFIYNFNDINGEDGQAYYTSTSFGEFDRTVTSGASVQNNAPTIPATIAAPLPTTLSATTPSTLDN